MSDQYRNETEAHPEPEAVQDEASRTSDDAFRRPPAKLSKFARWRMMLDMGFDRLLWLFAIGVLIFLLILASTWTQQITLTTIVMMVAAIVGWMMLNILSARTHREVMDMAGLIELDSDAAERYLVKLMRRRPLMRWVRLLLYHRMALLRHAQGQYEESADICRTLIERPMGQAERVRANTLLTLLHARLQLEDYSGAYEAIQHLQVSPMSLMERMTLLSLQTRYELGIEAYAQAVSGAWEKVQMSELMPPVLCGSLHVMLGRAAAEVGDEQMADWMDRRAALLLTPEQLEDARSGRNMDGFELSLVARDASDNAMESAHTTVANEPGSER